MVCVRIRNPTYVWTACGRHWASSGFGSVSSSAPWCQTGGGGQPVTPQTATAGRFCLPHPLQRCRLLDISGTSGPCLGEKCSGRCRRRAAQIDFLSTVIFYAWVGGTWSLRSCRGLRTSSTACWNVMPLKVGLHLGREGTWWHCFILKWFHSQLHTCCGTPRFSKQIQYSKYKTLYQL